MKKLLTSLCLAAMTLGAHAVNPVKGEYYLYCHMSDKGQWTAFAVSKDGLNYEDILGGDSVFSSYEHARIEGGTRDAYICRAYDKKNFVMVTTDMNNRMTKKLGKNSEWENFGIDLLRSNDLIKWKSVSFDFRKGLSIFCDGNDKNITPVYKDWSKICRVWAPQIFWDETYVWKDGSQGAYFIYYSMLNRAEDKYDRMFYSYADKSFTKMTQPQQLFDWGYATIDADINYVPADGLFHMMIKKEGGKPGLFTATASKLRGPWSEPVEDDYVSFEGRKNCEGVSAFQIDGEEGWRIAYIEYSSHPKHYRICKADKFMRNFSDPHDIQGVTAPQHGSFMRITKAEYDRLKKWSDSKKKK